MSNLTSTADHPTLVEPSWNHHKPPRTTPQQNLVKRWWNPRKTEPGETLPGTLVEPYLKLFWSTPALAEPGGNLVETWWYLKITPDHPAALAEPGGEPWCNPRKTLPQSTPEPLQNLVEIWWNPSWNLTSGPPRTTPEPIWAETPKLSAVGEKMEKHSPSSASASSGPGVCFFGFLVFVLFCFLLVPLLMNTKKTKKHSPSSEDNTLLMLS